jgi:predicted transcriptional regulator
MSEPEDTFDDLRQRLKKLADPLVQHLDTRLTDQIDRRVDERVDATLTNRLAVIERALADLDRAVRALEARVEAAS